MRRHQNCLVCKKELTGRSDQKYCSKKCRDTKNNENYLNRNTVLRKRITEIKQNKKLLDEMYRLIGEKPVPANLFPDHLFKESYTGTTKDGNIHIAEFEIRALNNGMLQIHKHKLQ
ncbi:hypothetical protein [Jiulongibacter sediminis]|uniref:DUF2116 family Zn-ribbon domain-containing protein n=1 Tax=Jiulongibacter sediminis TaxID=1605367 RepID=A0A0P7BYY7_9BACT|nr:hypothetical protein [Jiulongibacter sediminis]KPM46795.1 hypothetical protein AFM12_18775 [Jiulongibacter sediminis]TBX21700.1 hypothetical protein TK44_18780 [Jiulongibacter sediminis]